MPNTHMHRKEPTDSTPKAAPTKQSAAKQPQQPRPDSPVNVVAAGGLTVLSFATFVVEGAMFNVLLKPKLNMTLTTLMLGDPK